MFSQRFQIIDIVDRQSQYCLLVMSTSKRQLIQYTRYLMCDYAVKMNVDFKIYISLDESIQNNPPRNSVIYDLLQTYRRIIVLNDYCCLNRETPNLLEQVKDDEFGGVILRHPIVQEECQMILTQVGYHAVPEDYINSGVYIISKNHQHLFDKNNYQYYLNFMTSVNLQRIFINLMLQKTLTKKHILDVRYGNSQLDPNRDLGSSFKTILNQTYIRENFIMCVTDHYKYQLFYLKQTCEIYANKCYLVPNIRLDLDVIGDIMDEINHFKQSKKSKFKMLVFNAGPECPIWYHLTDRMAMFANDDNDIEQKEHMIMNRIHNVNVIEYFNHNLLVSNSFTVGRQILDQIPPPIKNTIFDLILICGTSVDTDDQRSHLLPIYWTNRYLSHRGTIIYLSDSHQLLTKFCMDQYLGPVNYRTIKHFDDQCATLKIVKSK